MPKIATSIMVEQVMNPRFDEAKNKKEEQYLYRVTQTKNTLKVFIDQFLTAREVKDLICDGVQVTVKGKN